jgi:hypothetical protein
MSNLLNISPVLPANDIEAEISFFEKLGFEKVYDSLRYGDNLDYAVMHREGQNIHIQFQFEKDMPSKKSPQQTKIWVKDLDALHVEFEQSGFSIKRRDKTDWGTNEFGLYSPNNNAIIFVEDLS